MKTAVTLCRVPESAAGPFVFHDPLPEGFAKAAAHGFDAVELFLEGPDAVPVEEIQALQQEHGLAIAAVGTGAGMVKHGLSLTDPSPEKRHAAFEFLLRMIGFGGRLGAPAILGSMQGKWSAVVPRDHALDLLASSLRAAGEAAAAFGVPFIYEPLNRYETNLFNHLVAAARFLDEREIPNVVLLADLFHMNIEEQGIAAALREAAPRLGHVHWADSNRRAMGFGHTAAAPIMAALREISYSGYLSAEIFPLPDADTAARQTLQSLITTS
jgi:sugar phosphate isomerase/epimerase